MYLLFDIGGTHTRLSVSEDYKTLIKPIVIDTPKSFEEGIKVIEETFRDFSQGSQIKGIAGGIAGPLDKNKTKLINAPHLKQWVSKPIKSILERMFNVPVYLENDTSLEGLGEAIRGAGKKKDIVVYLTVSTGVGGARVVNKVIDDNAFGFEPGHQILNITDHMFSNESDGGTLEGYISGYAIEERYKKKPWEITSDEVWEKTAKYLAYGLYNTILFWSPHVIILGGSVMKSIPLDRVKYHLQKTMNIFTDLPDLKPAELGQMGGLYGAMELLRVQTSN